MGVVSLLLAVLFPSQFEGRVIAVHDGDTITVLDGRQVVRVRLYGIDAPEINQPFGREAQRFVSGLVLYRPVRIRKTGVDRYGRVIGRVTMPDGKSLNHAVVSAGYAWWYRQYAPDEIMLGALEYKARITRAGLWAERQPVAPWVFRKENGALSATR